MLRTCVVVWCAVALGACIDADLVPCENGVACPAGTVCDEPHKTCVTPEQATVCRFKLERDPCLENGACHHGICVPIECGNWLRDPVEMCDDGNTISGDGCSADCTTDETCGNGVIDPARGEVCDDGALASHDGCDSRCRTETMRFTPLVQTTGLLREFAAHAFDDARGTLVIFGGLDENGDRRGETLEFDGATRALRVRTPQISPTPRHGAAMAYDAERNHVVLFGGSGLAGPVADTWTWDGEQWHVMQPATSPSPRLQASITYDSRRNRVLLFGGRGANGVLADLWAWDGTTWIELTESSIVPPPRERAMFAYDPVHDRVVLFGGIASGIAQPDMWLFDGTTWETLTPPGIPSARLGGTLTFDAVRGGLVMIGGSVPSPALLWDGNQWTAIGVSNTVMAGREYHIAFFDPQIGATVGGLGSIAAVLQPDLHRLDGDAWSVLAQTEGPPGLNHASMAYDMRRGEVVMFGGTFGGSSRETWLHDGTTWIQKTPMQPPPARFAAAMAYDEGRGKVVMWGGNPLDADVHEWEGFEWSLTTPAAPSPTPRARAEMVYDPMSRTTVMFGGESGAERFGDTWQWNGAAWTEVTTSPAPSARSHHTMAYDRARGEVVLFGGIEAVTNERLADTWTWTASGGWVLRQPLASPSPRIQAVMANDPYRDEVVLVGGTQGNNPLGDVWTWDGTTWSRRFPDDPPPLLAAAAAAYDNARRHLIVFGSEGTWRLQWRGTAADEACRTAIDRDGDQLRGCADPDCAAYCTPLCPDASANSPCAGPICGDQMCSPVESCRLCDRDCGFCTARCGDSYCDGGETCSGECP
ncbi:MAG: kelch repeat-containing protein [Kofleriaceae bacterium]